MDESFIHKNLADKRNSMRTNIGSLKRDFEKNCRLIHIYPNVTRMLRWQNLAKHSKSAWGRIRNEDRSAGRPRCSLNVLALEATLL